MFCGDAFSLSTRALTRTRRGSAPSLHLPSRLPLIPSVTSRKRARARRSERDLQAHLFPTPCLSRRGVRSECANPVFRCCDCVQIPCLHRKHQCCDSLSLRLLLPWRPRSRPATVGFEDNLEQRPLCYYWACALCACPRVAPVSVGGVLHAAMTTAVRRCGRKP